MGSYVMGDAVGVHADSERSEQKIGWNRRGKNTAAAAAAAAAAAMAPAAVRKERGERSVHCGSRRGDVDVPKA